MTMQELIDALYNSEVPLDIEICSTHHLTRDLHMNSLSLMLLMIHLDEKTGNSLDPRLFARAETVQGLYEILRELEIDT